ncbi:MAG TPA: hypothetical protein VFJ58_02325 [Armatimonadota bacterium]|nr:hypothetical protein [Armatimonadota bacterium]
MAEPALNVGDKIVITAGPFRGGHAIVKSVDQQHLRVEMQVLGQPATFTIRSDQLRRAERQIPDGDTSHLKAHHL